MWQGRDAAHNLKKLLPFFLRCKIKYYFLDNRLAKWEIPLAMHLKTLRYPVLMSAFQKSGNTWTQFVFFNYYNILINKAEKTMTYQELYNMPLHTLEPPSLHPFRPGFPEIYHTHSPFRKIFNLFSRRLYIYRNPLDTLISFYHFLGNRKEPFDGCPVAELKKLHHLDYFVLYYLPYWSYHYKSSIGHADAVLCYEEMCQDAFREFSRVFEILGFALDDAALRKSIEMSSFESIRKMGRETKQPYGGANPDDFKGEFTRSGKSGQYLKDLRPQTIEKTQRFLSKYGIAIKL